MCMAGHLAELESTAWKDDRRFRILVADAGALSFSDLYLNTPTKVGLRTVLALGQLLQKAVLTNNTK